MITIRFFSFLVFVLFIVSILFNKGYGIEENYPVKPPPSLVEGDAICRKFEQLIALGKENIKEGLAYAIITDYFKSTVSNRYYFNVVFCAIPLRNGKKFGYFVYVTESPQLGPIIGVFE